MSDAALLLQDASWNRAAPPAPELRRPRPVASRRWIDEVIHGHEGQSYRSAGLIFGFFPDPAVTLAAATLLRSAGMHVSVFGCQLVISP